MKFNKRHIINILITLVAAFLYFYLFLPPLNIHSLDFWVFFIFIYLLYLLLNLFSFVGYATLKGGHLTTIKLSKAFKMMFAVVPLIIAVILVVNFILSPLFFSGSYAKRITITEGKKFEEDIKEVDFNKVPLLDKASTEKTGDRVMGEMTDLVSQFTVSNLYTQINYNDKIVRVTPLEYAGIIKYFTNRGEGITGYIVVDSVTGKAELVRLEKGMKYMPSAMFNEKLSRKLRFTYPTEIFGKETFELDNDGNPYWIVPTLSYSGVGLKEEVSGVVILDPITGDSKKYDVDEIPAWVDHVYSPELIMEQVNDWGHYNNGFLNSIFGQKNVVETTTGYNYIIQDDDVYLYTGITSVASDESNLGFILTNLRTKQTNYYLIPGAEEYSAMASAKGQVQQMNYTSTFPLLINLNGKATYLISLKDNAGLIKMYAFVDVQNYQKVTVTDAAEGIIKAKENYLKNNKIGNEGKREKEKITIKTITPVYIDQNTYYYIEATNNKKYRVSIKVDEYSLPFLKPGSEITVHINTGTELNEIEKIE